MKDYRPIAPVIICKPGELMADKRRRQARDRAGGMAALRKNSIFAGLDGRGRIIHDPKVFYDGRF